ncbi:hypothetical protein [Caldifermentibacillus hisashii]|uniref:hypothetical protein n=1 Tax=Caldifermentibacillus hisashii TaxID=996558 RepID=UPI0031B6B428
MNTFNFKELINILNIEKIIIFGNKNFESNDIDLLIISSDFEEMYTIKRREFVRRYINSNKKLDLICLTPCEYQRMKRFPNKFSTDIILKGEVVYAR